MKNQRAIIRAFGRPDAIEILEESGLPQPKPGEVRIRVEASSILATDTLIRKGIYPLLRDKPPFTPGYDLVGVIDALGEGVSGWQVGQRVADISQIGGNARYVCRPAANLLPVPTGVDAAEAVCLVVSGMTAYQMLKHTAAVQTRQRILVHGGSGAVGTLLLQLGRLMGIELVATASASKLDLIRACGATAIDYRAADCDDQLRQAAGSGFDAVFDAVGVPSFRRSYRLLKPSGTLVTYGTFALARAIPKRTTGQFLRFGMNFAVWMLTLRFWSALPGRRQARFFGIVDSRRDFPERFADDLTYLFSLLQTGQIQPLVFDRLPLTDVRQAHELLESGQVSGQLVLLMKSPKNLVS